MLRQRLARRIRLVGLAMLSVWLILAGPPTAAVAHPLGNFTVNLYSRLQLGAEQIDLTYIVDLAEIPTYQEFGGTTLSAQAQAAYLERVLPTLRDGLRLTVDGGTPELRTVGQQLDFPPGQGGLNTTRLTLRFTVALPKLAEGAQRSIIYEDRNYTDRLGWHEIVAQPAPGAHLLRSDVSSADLSNELRSYPQDMLSSPLDIRMARLTVVPGISQPATPSLQSVPAQRPTDRFAALITTDELSPLVLIVALLSALGLGATHALAPGHGKTIVAAYLIGSRGTTRHALFLGMTVTVTHTIGVFALGLITLYASRYILPEQLYPWLGLLSGALIVGMGITLLRQRLAAIASSRSEHGHTPSQRHHHAAHDHAHHHDHGHDHHHDHAHHHDHDHGHDHAHHHDHDDGLTHSHGGQTHTHVVPGADGGRITWRSLLALGVSGGLIPCPSALVLMLSAISLGRIGMGLLLIVAFSLGLAGVLTGIGMLFVHGGRWLTQFNYGRKQRLSMGLRFLPVLSALIVTTAGLVITAQAIVQTGLLR
jgi:ABC-type nickel/cobalt efflux system permease component RcnA